MREDAARAFLERAGAGQETIARLVAEDRLVEAIYGERRFYVRRL